MRIKVITAFEDLQESDPDKRLRAVDTELTVTRERGTELCGFGLAIDVTAHTEPPAGDKPGKN